MMKTSIKLKFRPSVKSDKEVYTITDNNVVIDIYYKKNSYDYKIEYYFDNVKDSSGLFFNSETNDEENKKEPYLYNGHDSWIYLFNDEVSNNDLSLFKWLASQSNSN